MFSCVVCPIRIRMGGRDAGTLARSDGCKPRGRGEKNGCSGWNGMEKLGLGSLREKCCVRTCVSGCILEYWHGVF